MRKFISLVLCLLPMLLLSQDTLPQLPFITKDTIIVQYKKVPTDTAYTFQITVDLQPAVEEFFDFMDRYDINPEALSMYSGMWTVNDIDNYAEDDNTLAVTFKSVPEAKVKAATLVNGKVNLSEFRLKILVFHEFTHVLTHNRVSHCKDWINCSAIFYTHLDPLAERIEKFWEMEEEQLANLIRIYQKYDPRYKN